MSDRITPEQARESLSAAFRLRDNGNYGAAREQSREVLAFIDQAERDAAELARLRAVGPLTPKPE